MNKRFLELEKWSDSFVGTNLNTILAVLATTANLISPSVLTFIFASGFTVNALKNSKEWLQLKKENKVKRHFR